MKGIAVFLGGETLTTIPQGVIILRSNEYQAEVFTVYGRISQIFIGCIVIRRSADAGDGEGLASQSQGVPQCGLVDFREPALQNSFTTLFRLPAFFQGDLIQDLPLPEEPVDQGPVPDEVHGKMLFQRNALFLDPGDLFVAQRSEGGELTVFLLQESIGFFGLVDDRVRRPHQAHHDVYGKHQQQGQGGIPGLAVLQVPQGLSKQDLLHATDPPIPPPGS